MLVNDNGHWFTINAYNFSCNSPQLKSLYVIDENMRRREIIKKHFTVDTSRGSPCCFLYYHGVYISAWLKGDKLASRWVIQAAANMYLCMGGK